MCSAVVALEQSRKACEFFTMEIGFLERSRVGWWGSFDCVLD